MTGEKGRDLNQSYDKSPITHIQEKIEEILLNPTLYYKSPYTQRKSQNATLQHTNATKNFDYTTIVDRLRTVSLCNDSHPTGVVLMIYDGQSNDSHQTGMVKPVNEIHSFPLTQKKCNQQDTMEHSLCL